jgi:hypothetical protein
MDLISRKYAEVSSESDDSDKEIQQIKQLTDPKNTKLVKKGAGNDEGKNVKDSLKVPQIPKIVSASVPLSSTSAANAAAASKD